MGAGNVGTVNLPQGVTMAFEMQPAQSSAPMQEGTENSELGAVKTLFETAEAGVEGCYGYQDYQDANVPNRVHISNDNVRITRDSLISKIVYMFAALFQRGVSQTELRQNLEQVAAAKNRYQCDQAMLKLNAKARIDEPLFYWKRYCNDHHQEVVQACTTLQMHDGTKQVIAISDPFEFPSVNIYKTGTEYNKIKEKFLTHWFPDCSPEVKSKAEKYLNYLVLTPEAAYKERVVVMHRLVDLCNANKSPNVHKPNHQGHIENVSDLDMFQVIPDGSTTCMQTGEVGVHEMIVIHCGNNSSDSYKVTERLLKCNIDTDSNYKWLEKNFQVPEEENGSTIVMPGCYSQGKSVSNGPLIENTIPTRTPRRRILGHG